MIPTNCKEIIITPNPDNTLKVIINGAKLKNDGHYVEGTVVYPRIHASVADLSIRNCASFNVDVLYDYDKNNECMFTILEE